MSQAGNGGEYWGFDGHIHPVRAAAESFEANDYRFLELDLRDSLGRSFTGIPAIRSCDSHPAGKSNFTRTSSNSLLHGIDSTGLATDFAHDFNQRMASLMKYELSIECEVVRSW